MIDRELKIARYTEGAMMPEEKTAFLAEAHADEELNEVLETENVIQSALRTDAAITEQSVIFDTTPGAPLLERLAMTSVSATTKSIYYIIGAAVVVVAVLALLLFRREPAQNPLSPPVPIQTEQSIPAATIPSGSANSGSAEHAHGKTERGKRHPEVKTTPQTQKDIDLDQDINGKPKIFTDPKGHMPIK